MRPVSFRLPFRARAAGGAEVWPGLDLLTTSVLMLDEQKSIALVSHIVQRRSAAAQLLEDLQSQALGISC